MTDEPSSINLRKEWAYVSPSNWMDYPPLPELTVSGPDVSLYGKTLTPEEIEELYLTHGFKRKCRWVSEWEDV